MLNFKKGAGGLKRNIYEKAWIYINYYNDPLIRKWHQKYARRLHKFKNKHKGQSCFIIGNGPSLNKMDLALLRDCHTFGLNKIYLIFDKVDINLNYHVAVNRLVLEQSISMFKELKCPSFLSYKAVQGLLDRDEERFYYIASGGPFTFSKDITFPIHEGHTVTYVALQIAYFMGFRFVYLIGMDHNFVVQGKANELQFMEGSDPNHFDPDYFKNNNWQLPNLEASELAYHMAKYFYNQDGRYIYDATCEGRLSIFPKISFEMALEKAKINNML